MAWHGRNGHNIDTIVFYCHIVRMAKAQLVEAVRKELGGEVSKADAARIVAAVFHAIKVGSQEDKVFELSGFGTFKFVKPPKSMGSGTAEETDLQKSKAIKVVLEKGAQTLSSRSPKPDIQGLTPNEMRLAEALFAVIRATGIGGKEALRVMRTIGERIEIPEDAEDEAFERVRLRSLDADVELRGAEGGGLSDSEFAGRLGVSSRETIRQYRGKGLIFAWPKDMRSYRYPAWQIHRRQLLPGLAEVLAVLKEKELEPFSMIGYFLTPSDDLDNARPLDLLREGKVAEVVADAKRYGDIGS
jgi:nucleoid DNA-binding protein